MKKSEVQIGGTYTAKVSDKLTKVRLDNENRHGGWDATNLTTGKKVRIKSAQRLRQPSGVLPSERLGVPATTPDVDLKLAAMQHDPDRCATPRCKSEVAMTYLGRPLCQKCCERECATEAAAMPTIVTEQAPANQEPAELEAQPDVTPTVEIVTGQPLPNDPAEHRQARAKRNGEPKPKRKSMLDAAAEVLQSQNKPLRCSDMIAAMAQQGLWSSPAGKTPEATLYTAIAREIKTKGSQARFRKVERGQFAFAGQEA